MKYKTIQEHFYRADQSLFYDLTVVSNHIHYRVNIRRNAYDDQSYIRGSVFCRNTMQWNQVASTPIEFSQCKESSYTQHINTINKSLFVKDAESLLEIMQQIVTGDEPQ